MWVCPSCNRPFKNRNQQHSCVHIPADMLLNDKSEKVCAIYERLKNITESIGDFQITATASAVFFKKNATFLAIKPKKMRVDLEFFLDREEDVFPVSRVVKISRNRVVHFISIEEPDQVDGQLAGWIRESCLLTSGAKQQD